MSAAQGGKSVTDLAMNYQLKFVLSVALLLPRNTEDFFKLMLGLTGASARTSLSLSLFDFEVIAPVSL